MIYKKREKIEEIFNRRQDKNPHFLYKLNVLIELYNIIEKYKKSFPFSPSFVISCIHKINLTLSYFVSNSNKPIQNSNESKEIDEIEFFNYFKSLLNGNDDQKQLKYNYLKLILLIKMRFSMMIHLTCNFLPLLIEFIVLKENSQNFDMEDDQISFKKAVNDSLPETKRRSKIIKNIPEEDVFDFCFSYDEEFDFILTKDGAFKVAPFDKSKGEFLTYGDSSFQKVEFKEQEAINESLKKCDKSKAKISYDNGILYLFLIEQKKIYQAQIQGQINPKAKKTRNENERKKEPKEGKKLSAKKLEKEAKRQRRMKEKEAEVEEKEVDLKSIILDIPDFPIVTMSASDNCIRIVQRKEYIEGKSAFIVTIFDLVSSNHLSYDVEEAFSKDFNEVSPEQFEITIEDKENKYKVVDSFISVNNLYFVFDDSTFEQWAINETNAGKITNMVSSILITPGTRLKMDKNSFLYFLEPVQNDSIAISKMHLPYTKYFLRSENEVFFNYPYLRKFSDIVDNCLHMIINRNVFKTFTTEEYYNVEDEDNKKVKKVKSTNPFEFSVSADEMSSVVQSISSLYSQIDFLKLLISEIKDENLRNFFIPLLIKIIAINLVYGTYTFYSSKDKMSDIMIRKFKKN